MDKNYYSPVEMLRISTQHAHCAQYLLNNNAEIEINNQDFSDSLLPICSLMYTAFELMFKAFLWHDHGPLKQYKNLGELLELNMNLGLSNQDKQLLKYLSKQLAFRKGVDYELWEDRSHHQMFCIDILDLYRRTQAIMPLELQADYQ